MAVERRRPIVEYLQHHIPDLEVVWVRQQGAMDTFLRHLDAAGSDPVIRLEDDIILTKNFVSTITAAVTEHPDHLIQFFTRHKENVDQGSRWMPGATYLWNQCCYLPAGMAQAIRRFYDEPLWAEKRYHDNNHHHIDVIIADYLHAYRLKYWLHNPSLVQHARTVSEIDRRRARNRHTRFVADLEYERFPAEYLP